MDEPKQQHMMSMMTVGEMCDLIEKEMARLGRDITNAELNELISKHAIETDSVISMSDKPFDSDLLTGNLREEGFRVLNTAEEERRKNKGKQ